MMEGEPETAAELSERRLFALGFCNCGATRFGAGLQAFDVFTVFSTDASVLFSSSRHALSSDLKNSTNGPRL